jgi:hypothetical protein
MDVVLAGKYPFYLVIELSYVSLYYLTYLPVSYDKIWHNAKDLTAVEKSTAEVTARRFES